MFRIWLRLATLLIGAMLLVSACAAPQAALRQSAPESAPAAAPRPAPAPESSADTARGAAPSSSGVTAPGQAPSTGNAGQALPEPFRKVIYTASLALEVTDVQRAQADVERMVRDLGGYVAGSTAKDDGERMNATITLKVPADNYPQAMSRLRGMAQRVRDESSTAQDVSEEYADLDAQLRNLQATEAQYLRLLERANTIDEILRVQQQISQVRGQIERVKGRLQFLDRRVEFSTITVTLTPVASTVRVGPGWDLLAVIARAWAGSLRVLQLFVEFVVTFVIYTWWLLIPAAAVVWFVRRRRAQRQTAERQAAA